MILKHLEEPITGLAVVYDISTDDNLFSDLCDLCTWLYEIDALRKCDVYIRVHGFNFELVLHS